MDLHLGTLDATLASIAQLQRHVLTNPKPQPFTNAYLAPIDPTLLASPRPPRDFIRECDAFERRLFHFPAPGGMIDDGGGSGSTGGGADGSGDKKMQRDVEEEAADVAAELVPRKPEIRTVSVPTPLRPSTQGNRNGAGPSKQYDARASLMAAQRLNDNYQRAPRARKHIRQLLKRNTELASQTAVHTAQAAKLEDVLARIASGEDPNSMMDELPALLGASSLDAAAPTTTATAHEDKAKKRRLKELRDKLQAARDELNREEMEVLALEEMRDDMLKRRRALQAGKKSTGSASSSTDAPLKKVPRVVAAAAAARAATTSKPRTSAEASSSSSSPKVSKSTAPVGPGVRKLAATARGRPSVAIASSKPATTALRKPSGVGAGPRASAAAPAAEPASTSAQAEGDEDVTVRLKPGEGAADDQPLPAAGDDGEDSLLIEPPSEPAVPSDPLARDPELTDELERLTEKVWDAFGDHLRFFAPHLESSDATTTLSLLRKLLATSTLQTGGGAAPLADDGSSVSSAAATTSSTASGNAGAMHVSSLTLQARVTALTLLNLFVNVDEGHSVEFPWLKTRARQWYDDEVAEEEKRLQEDSAVTDGEALVTKAVYAMVAKKLLRIRRSGGKARVGFS